MGFPLIKICGIKTIQTLLQCAEYKADFVGLNFSPKSKRQIELQTAKKIFYKTKTEKLNLKLVFLFYENSQQEIQEILSELTPDYIQYVTRDTQLDLEFLESFKIPLIHQIQVKNKISDKDLPSNEFIILDSYHENQGGGSGISFPWEFVKDVRRKYFLAGGLNPENVAQAVKFLQPYGLDVASGVEKNGEKDKELIRRFIQNARLT